MPQRLELAPLAYRNDRRRRISTAIVLGIISLIALPIWIKNRTTATETAAILYAVVMSATASMSALVWLGPSPRLRRPEPAAVPDDELPLARLMVAPDRDLDPELAHTFDTESPGAPPIALTYAARMPPPRPRGFPWWVDMVILPICLSLLTLVGWSMLNCCLVPTHNLRVVLSLLPGLLSFLLACRPTTPRTAHTHLWWLIGTSATLLTTPLALWIPDR